MLAGKHVVEFKFDPEIAACYGNSGFCGVGCIDLCAGLVLILAGQEEPVENWLRPVVKPDSGLFVKQAQNEP